jgi:acetylornithine deacetylase/succinyl-diaminopimelate desuccinylase-like protein
MNTDAVLEAWQARMVRFCQRLVQTPSLSGEEEDVAALIRAEMEHLHYDDVWVDEVGNVIGVMKGGGGPSLMLNCQMDQVDVGDPDEWPYGPFSAHIADGAIWGRGASDTKGAIAAQVYAVGLMKSLGFPSHRNESLGFPSHGNESLGFPSHGNESLSFPLRGNESPRDGAKGNSFPGDTYVTCVVHEETGSWGTKFLLGHLETDVAILGEATANQIAHGHRGRTEVIVHLQGRATHASAASRETNPLFALASFLRRVSSLSLPEDPTLGPAVLTPTRCYTDQESGNMTPDQAWLHLDWRSLPDDRAAAHCTVPDGTGLPSQCEGKRVQPRLPGSFQYECEPRSPGSRSGSFDVGAGSSAGDGPRVLLDELRAILEESCPSGVTGTVELLAQDLRSYTGMEASLPTSAPSYLLEPGHPLVSSAREILEEYLARPVRVAPWNFTTDGGYLVEAGIPTIGFSPCEERYAHTTQDQVRIDLMVEAVQGTMALVAGLPRCLGAMS